MADGNGGAGRFNLWTVETQMKKLELIDDWQAVLKRAWSLKCSVLAALLGGAEVAVSMIQPAGIPNGAFAGIAAGVSVAAGIARLVAQQELSGAGNADQKQ